ncbi:unnamed protein product [Darwinula stevensoni]|uniref:Uncharacterized protein n=1 Tax=Darwinula stevensoni TaxID=69355 RepID=A0A7R8X0J8_9CRUS|nr:unnamed protein product [Darwinula stevensoni]CAG0878939.1 unnamed protein product [Darwinula stevensoni]
MTSWTILLAVGLILGESAGEPRVDTPQSAPHVAIVNPMRSQMILYSDFPQGSCLLYGDE